MTGIGAASFGDHAAHLASGIALASPIAVIKWLSWSPAVHEELPSIEAMHNSYEKNVPEMGALSLFQVCLFLLVCLDFFPSGHSNLYIEP